MALYNRFYGIEGDDSVQIAPWEMRRRGYAPQPALFELHAPIRYFSDIAGGDIVVPAGFVSDVATIPQFAWSFFMTPDDPRVDLPAWIHDFLYDQAGIFDVTKPALTKDEADRILAFEAMAECGAKLWQQHAIYYAVHYGGKGAWTVPGYTTRLYK